MKRTRIICTLCLLAALLISCTACGASSAPMDSMAGGDRYYNSADFDYNLKAESESFVTSSPAISDGAMNAPVKPEESTGGTADPLSQRKIVKTMRISAETKAFDRATASIEALCAQLGGYIEASSRSGVLGEYLPSDLGKLGWRGCDRRTVCSHNLAAVWLLLIRYLYHKYLTVKTEVSTRH